MISKSQVMLLTTVLLTGIMTLNQANTNNQECPVGVEILASTSSWCAGTNQYNTYTIVQWDQTAITFVTVGVANLDKMAHTIQQLNVTIHQYVSDPSGSTGPFVKFLKSESLTTEAGLPLVLYPGYYWQHDLSSDEKCQTIAKIALEVDGEWYEFYPAIVGGNYSSWPSHWTNVQYYTEYTEPTTPPPTTSESSSVSSPGINLSPYSLISLVVSLGILGLVRKKAS